MFKFSKTPEQKKAKEQDRRLKRAQTVGAAVPDGPRMMLDEEVLQTMSPRFNASSIDEQMNANKALSPVNAPSFDFRTGLKKTGKRISQLDRKTNPSVADKGEHVVDWRQVSKKQKEAPKNNNDKMKQAYQRYKFRIEENAKTLDKTIAATLPLIDHLLSFKTASDKDGNESSDKVLASFNSASTEVSGLIVQQMKAIQSLNDTISNEITAAKQKIEEDKRRREMDEARRAAEVAHAAKVEAQQAAAANSGGGLPKSGGNGPPPPVPLPPVPQQKVFFAKYDYPGGYRQDKELIFKTGERVVEVKTEGDWIFGRKEDDPTAEGWFPSNYVDPL